MPSSLLDGPLQKQIILLKLVHEMGNRPIFGNNFDNDPDGDIRLWLARVGALMDRVGIRASVNYQSSLSTAAQYWVPSMKSVQVTIRNAIEELKLELELGGNDQIGQVYEEGKSYEFFSDLVKVIQEAKQEVFVIDPYFDSATFSQMFSTNFTTRLKILCSKNAQAVASTAQKFCESNNSSAVVKKSNKLHDRLIVVDNTDCWLVGASIKDAGRKPTYLVPLIADLSNEKISIYEEIWNSASAP